MTQLIKPITVEIEKDLWDSFKIKVPRTIRLNDQVVELIRGFVNDRD